MNKEQAIHLLEAVAWTYWEGQGHDEMYQAARAMIDHFGITEADCEGPEYTHPGCVSGYLCTMELTSEQD